jgi:hypothetical protein
MMRKVEDYDIGYIVAMALCVISFAALLITIKICLFK